MRKPTRTVVTDEIYEIIKELILSHKLKPGDKINIDQLAKELQVSNIPIRESLSRLAAERLVTAVPFKGMFVTHMSLKELGEMFELRMALELFALRKAFPSLDRNEMRRVLAEWQAAVLPHKQTLEETLQTVAKMNEELHGLYLNRCENDTLTQLIKLYIERIQRYYLVMKSDIRNDLLQIEHEEHLQVLTALASGDVEQAARKLELHLAESLSRARNYVSGA